MAKQIFESQFPYRSIRASFGLLEFQRNRRSGLGELDADAAARRYKVELKDVVAVLERHPQFSARKEVGATIWPQEVRVDAESVAQLAEAAKTKGWDAAHLRKKIAKLGGKAPVTASTAELLGILNGLLDKPEAADKTGDKTE